MTNISLYKVSVAILISTLFIFCAASVMVTDAAVEEEDEHPEIIITDGKITKGGDVCKWDENTHTLTVPAGKYERISDASESNADYVLTIEFTGDCELFGHNGTPIYSIHDVKINGNGHSIKETEATTGSGIHCKSLIMNGFDDVMFKGRYGLALESATIYATDGNVEIRNCKSVDLIACEQGEICSASVYAKGKLIVENSKMTLTYKGESETTPDQKTTIAMAEGGMKISNSNVDSRLKCFNDLEGKSEAAFNEKTLMITCEKFGTYTLSNGGSSDNDSQVPLLIGISIIIVLAIAILFFAITKRNE